MEIKLHAQRDSMNSDAGRTKVLVSESDGTIEISIEGDYDNDRTVAVDASELRRAINAIKEAE